MSARFTVDVGAQYVEGTVRLAVRAVGQDADGSYADIAVGPFPATIVRLRVGRPVGLGHGRTIRLGGLSPAGVRPAVALEVTQADES